MRTLTVIELNEVNGAAVPIVANIGIRAAAGGLIAGTAAYKAAMSDGVMTEEEGWAVLAAVGAGAATGAAGGIYKWLGM
jgi:hypothetical protein